MALIGSYPVMQVRPYGLLVYEQKEFDTIRAFNRSRVSNSIVQYTGVLTPFAKKNLKRAVSLLVASAKEKEATNFKTGKQFSFKLNFITFTLPAIQEQKNDEQIKICLDNWIKRAKRKYKLNNYVWRAERQANGNIHFHMVSDTWIHYENIRSDWNEVLQPTGLVNKYTEKHQQLSLTQYLQLYPPNTKISKAARIVAYKRGCATQWKNPNTTDVHAIHKIKNLTSYFIKYMSKAHKEGEEPIKGKVWDCSQNLKTKKNCWFHLQGAALQTWEYCYNKLELEKITDPLFTIIFIPTAKFSQYICKEIRDVWEEYLKGIREGFQTPVECSAQ